MEIGVEVSAAVLDDRQTEIGIGCFEQSGEDNAAGGDAAENQRVNVIGAEDHGEVGAGEGTDAMLGDDNFAFFRRDDSRDRSERFLKQFLMLRRGFNGAEENVSRTDLRQPGTKADLDMDNGHAGGTRVVEDACGTSQEGVFVLFGVDGDDAGLAIHAQDGGVSRIDRRCSGHIAPHAAEGFLPDSILIQQRLTLGSCLIVGDKHRHSTGAADKAVNLAGCKSPHHQLPGTE